MSSLSFEWEPVKARTNLEKHNVSFEEAASAFLDERGRVISDPDHRAEEGRQILLGMSRRWRLLVVCFRHRRRSEVIRIISARPATRRECRQYRAEWS